LPEEPACYAVQFLSVSCHFAFWERVFLENTAAYLKTNSFLLSPIFFASAKIRDNYTAASGQIREWCFSSYSPFHQEPETYIVLG